MITLKNTYESRKKEIVNFIELMCFLEKKKIFSEEEEVDFDKFFHGDAGGIQLTYQELINILKSNVSLMIYNLIEFTVSGLIECIYDEIRIQNLSYLDVNESIRKMWRKTILKAIKDPNANFNTFLKRNEEIIEYILSNQTIDMHARDCMPGGNLDGVSIKETFESHGIQIKTNSQNYRPDILKNIKENRNNLAHGSVSFVEAVRDNSINDINTNTKFIIAFLEELIDIVDEFNNKKKYII